MNTLGESGQIERGGAIREDVRAWAIIMLGRPPGALSERGITAAATHEAMRGLQPLEKPDGTQVARTYGWLPSLGHVGSWTSMPRPATSRLRKSSASRIAKAGLRPSRCFT